MRGLTRVVLAGLLAMAWGCSHTINVHHEVEPIYITVQVNIQVQEQLNDFFDFEEDAQK